MLAEASTLLATDFDVVAAVRDGQQALDASLWLNPDVVILDISMPVLDGPQTARELKRAGSRRARSGWWLAQRREGVSYHAEVRVEYPAQTTTRHGIVTVRPSFDLADRPFPIEWNAARAGNTYFSHDRKAPKSNAST